MIRLEGLEVTFGRGTVLETRALAGIDLALAEAEFVTVIGSNGAGKSTLLNALTGDATPERGRIEIAGQDITGWSPSARARLIARVFQDPQAGSCAALTIEENLALAAARGRRRGLGRALHRSLRGELCARLARPRPGPGEAPGRSHGAALGRPAPGGQPPDGDARADADPACSTSTPRRSTPRPPSSCSS